MRCSLIVGLALAALAAPALAGPYDAPDGYGNTVQRQRYRDDGEGVRVRDRVNGANLRLNVDCDLIIRGREPYSGKCNIGRRNNGRVTIIDTANRQYKIVRDAEDPVDAEFYRDGDWIDTVSSNGSCWKGALVTFCAR